MRNLSLLAISMLGLTSCGWGRGDYPALAQEMLGKDFPADGAIHIQRRGVFDIKSGTNFCTYRPGYQLDERDVLDALASRNTSQANQQFGERVSPECGEKRTGNPIFVRSGPVRNRAGPYKLTVAIWQGEAVWVAVIERRDGLRPDAVAEHVPVNDGPGFFLPTQAQLKKEARQENSQQLDWRDISKAFFKDAKSG